MEIIRFIFDCFILGIVINYKNAFVNQFQKYNERLVGKFSTFNLGILWNFKINKQRW